jgi:hypothetical protein
VKVVVALAVFLLFTGSLLGFALALTAFGRWRGWGDSVAPEVERPPRSEWPLLCRLHLYHRWHSYRSAEGRYQRCSGCGHTRDVPAIPPI